MGQVKIKKLNEYYREFTDEFNEIRDFRLQVLFLHLHMDYWVNKIIERTFRKPEIIFKNERLRSFSSKVDLLESLGIIYNEGLLKRLRLTNEIRNYYSHNIVKKYEFPQEIQDKINEIMKTQPQGRVDSERLRIHPAHQFVVSSAGVIIQLYTHYKETEIRIK